MITSLLTINHKYQVFISSERFIRAGYIKLVLLPYVHSALQNVTAAETTVEYIAVDIRRWSTNDDLRYWESSFRGLHLVYD
jgi:hypothetical protein